MRTMAGGTPHATDRSATWRAWAFALLIPLVLGAQWLGGRALLRHAHDEHGEHLHLLPVTQDSAQLPTAGDWHRSSHGPAHAAPSPSEDPPAPPDGVLVELPPMLAAPRGEPLAAISLAARVRVLHACMLGAPARAEPCARRPEPEPDPPRADRHGNGVERLLLSSRALRI